MPLSAERRRQLRTQKRPPQICYRCGKQMMKRLGAKYCSDACRQPLSPKAADHLVRRYFKRRLPPPETLNPLLRTIGLIPSDARLLRQTFGPHYWSMRYAQAWRRATPPKSDAIAAWKIDLK